MKLEKKVNRVFFLRNPVQFNAGKVADNDFYITGEGGVKKLVREERSSGTNVTERAMECKDHGAGELSHLNPVLFSQMRWRQ